MSYPFILFIEIKKPGFEPGFEAFRLD